jgi:hypothetical protein
MKFFKRMKDGGKESTVTGYWLCEIKSLFSICLLKFEGKSREAFHTHAFNCWSIVLKGKLTETMLDGSIRTHKPRLIPFRTTREDFHKVDSDGTTWILTLRGKWVDYWKEYLPKENRHITLTHGRKLV